MKILILGGTQFVGLHLTQAAIDAGHEVTLFNRGRTNTHLFPDVEKLVGDRNESGGYDALKGRTWDAAIDVTAYFPRQVKELLEVLSGSIEHFTYISTVSVYADFSKEITEDSPLAELEDPTTEEITGGTYGGLKVLCEVQAEKYMPGKTLTIRPTYVVGPHDHTDRFTYWLTRTAKGGEMLAPGSPDENLRIIDGRDLAEWTIRLVEAKQTGIYNGVGPDYDLTFGEVVETVKNLIGSDTEFVWVSQEFAEENDILGNPMPLWNPGPEYVGMRTTSNKNAVAVGLTYRSLEETIKETLAWRATANEDVIKWEVGMAPEKEAELIEKWKGGVKD